MSDNPHLHPEAAPEFEPVRRMDRRTMIKWLATATAALPLTDRFALGADQPAATGYGPDPDVTKIYQPGELWPLTLTPAQGRTVAALCDTIIPADSESPAASQVGIPAFIDEWISAPYGADKRYRFTADRNLVLDGLVWLEDESHRRFSNDFAALTQAQRDAICDDICSPATAKPEYKRGVRFFSRFRDLTAGGFYTTPEGMRDLQYVGNTPQAGFNGPPKEALQKVGLL